MPQVPSAEEIRTTESKVRSLPIEPWVAAGFARLWQTMKIHIQNSIDVGKQEQPHTVQSAPASARNHS
jgi:hypothetical protein